MPLTTTSDVVRRLEARGYVRRHAEPGRRPLVLFELSAAGDREWRRGWGALQRINAHPARRARRGRGRRARRARSPRRRLRSSVNRRLIRIRSSYSGSGLSSPAMRTLPIALVAAGALAVAAARRRRCADRASRRSRSPPRRRRARQPAALDSSG